MSIADKLVRVARNEKLVHNAGYNAGYKKAMEDFCPEFRDAGSVVQFTPALGSMITIDKPDFGFDYIEVCGKNLFNYKEHTLSEGKYIVSSGKASQYSASSNYACCESFICVSHLRGKTITINHPPVETSGSNPKAVFYTYNNENSAIEGSATNGYTMTVPENARYMRFSFPKKYIDGTELQIEIGDTVTDYEAYRGIITYDLNDFDGNGFVELEAATNGIHTIACVLSNYFSVDIYPEVSVSGLEDTISVINKLKQQTTSVEG